MDFKRAIAIAEKNAKELVPEAYSFTPEGAIISDGNYEITLSYYVAGKGPLELTSGEDGKNNLSKLATLMGMKREYKVFIVDEHDFSFKGFKPSKEG